MSLTVVVTAHRVPFLEEALASLARQTVRAHHTVLVADLLGPEGRHVADIMRGALSAFQCASLVLTHGGTAGRTRNAGFAAARTDWVTYLDGDDCLHPRAVEATQAAIRRHPEARLFSSGIATRDYHGVLHPHPDSLHYNPPAWIYETNPEPLGHLTWFYQLLVVRRSAWFEYPFIDALGEDYDFILTQLLLGKMRKIPEYLYEYRRDNSGSWGKVGHDVVAERYAAGIYLDRWRRLYGPHSHDFTR